MSNDEKWDKLPEHSKSEVLHALTIGLRSTAQGVRALGAATLRAAEALQRAADSMAEKDEQPPVTPTEPPVAPTGPTGATGPTGPPQNP